MQRNFRRMALFIGGCVIQITPDHLAAMYDCMRHMPPFSDWNLPVAEEVEFHVTRSRKDRGSYTCWISGPHAGTHIITVSAANIGHFISLAQVMAHEMIHLKQRRDRTETPKTKHNAEFCQIAWVVCDTHGWDQKLFV